VNAPDEHGSEHPRKEGLVGRVRRFVETELTGVSSKHDREDEPDRAGTIPPDQREEPDVSASAEAGRTREAPQPPASPQPTHPEPVITHPEPVATHPPAPPIDVESPAAPIALDDAPADADYTQTPEHVEEPRGRSGDQVAADISAERVGLLNDAAGLRDEWRRVQGTFVDDPQSAVHEASRLVERTLEEIRANVASLHTSKTPSTEDLRVSFQRYREFFQRLLSA
jgi:hypothetical protein